MHEEVKTLKQMLAKSNSDCVDLNTAKNLEKSIASRFHLIWSVFQAHSGAEDEFIWPALELKLKREDNNNNKSSADGNMCCFGAEEYEEDHQEEEKLFKDVNTTLGRLKGSFRFYDAHKIAKRSQALFIMKKASAMLDDQIDGLVRHLTQHLEKEETQCLPKIQSLLTKEEISSLVGNIMGKRSAELMGKILELAVKQLPMDERDDMVRHMKDAMAGTFFVKWLDVCFKDKVASLPNDCSSKKRKHPEVDNNESESLEKPTRKISFCSTSDIPETSQRHPPAKYYKAQKSGKIICLYDSESSSNKTLNSAIPLLTKEELRPTYHYNKEGETKLGCKHYARACKIRHPLTGQIFNCRLCCEEVREANGYRDLPVLDRNEVTEVMCMRCNTLQPAGPACISDKCRAKPRFAKYSCKICNLYDDSNKNIYHCPYCNVCRKGKGLGIDFRHCMRCNACISLKEYNDHVCIPQRLQGNCPICHEKLFESTAPLRGLPCGHVMHLSCFKLYVANSSRLGTIACPYCKREFQNINE
jgi:hemerythrin superfamily protein